MINPEDRLWDYIDGTCNEQERKTIEQLLETDVVWKQKYEELTALHQQLKSMELDEPSMGFRYQVMEQVLASPHPSLLKTKVDRRIILAIAGFFILLITGLLGYTLSQVDWSSTSGSSLPSWNLPKINWSIFDSSGFMLLFLTADVIIGLFFLDKFISARRRKNEEARAT